MTGFMTPVLTRKEVGIKDSPRYIIIIIIVEEGLKTLAPVMGGLLGISIVFSAPPPPVGLKTPAWVWGMPHL